MRVIPRNDMVVLRGGAGSCRPDVWKREEREEQENLVEVERRSGWYRQVHVCVRGVCGWFTLAASSAPPRPVQMQAAAVAAAAVAVQRSLSS